MHKLVGLVLIMGAFALLLGSTPSTGAQGVRGRPVAPPDGAFTPTATATPIPWVDLSCPTCMAYGIGNPTPIAVGNGSGPGNCPNCVLQNQKFWASIAGPGTDDREGDPYNTRYIDSQEGFNCTTYQLNTATPNPVYVAAPNPDAGYNYAVNVDPAQGDLGLYVYDPAQYYRSGGGGTTLDTGDGETCAPFTNRYRYRTYFQIWQPDNTPYYFTDDVPLGPPVSFQDDGTPAYHNKWFLVGTLPAGLAANGRFRLQVYTDDVNNSGTYGMGANQFALALGGPRAPANTETISPLGAGSLYLNLRQVSGPDLTWYLARIGGEHAGEQVSIMLFDPGDADCATSLQLFRESDPANPVPFDVNWTGVLTTSLRTIDTSYPRGDPRRYPYNGQWVTLGVTLPANYTDDYWKLKYITAGCGNISNDVITWQAFYGGPTATPSATATPVSTTPTNTPTFTPTATHTPTFTSTATLPPMQTPPPSVTAPPSASATGTSLPSATGTRTAGPGPSVTGTATASPVASATSTPPSATATATVCPIQFVDVPPGSTFYAYIRCLACRGIVGGYPCGGPGEPCPGNYYRSNNNVTRGQLAKIIASAAGLSDPVSGQTFEDVAPGSTFYTPIEQLAGRGVIGGYACGGVFEPCVAPGNRPYYRPNNPATRGQIAKIVSNTAQFTETPTGQTFADVPPGSTFYLYIERIAGRGIVTGYPCGGAGEPCLPPGNRPYFRPNNATTRGQMSKIAAATFLPNCQTPGREIRN